MNPYLIPLMAVPVLMTFAASLQKGRRWRWSLLLLAMITFWGLLQPTVIWAYAHPFNPDDGGAKAFALLFGWAYGLVLVIVPSFLTSKVVQWILNRIRTHTPARPAGGDTS